MKPIYALAVGDFGTEVLRRLQEIVPGTDGADLTDRAAIHPATMPMASIYMVLAWRPVPKLCRTLDGLSHAWRVPWLSVIQEHPYLRVGPVVVPGHEGCFHCYEKRIAQHSPNAALVSLLNEYYDANQAAGPKGYLPALAGMAAAMAAELATGALERPESVAGSVRQFQVISRDLVQGQVVGVHACPRCGLQRDERTRSFDTLQQDYKRIFGQTAPSEVGV